MTVQELFTRLERKLLSDDAGSRVLLFPLEQRDYAYAVRNENFPVVNGLLMIDYANSEEESDAYGITPRQFGNMLRDAIEEGYADAIVAAETLFTSASVNVVTGIDVDADIITLETRKVSVTT